jgi:hypothetical protein
MAAHRAFAAFLAISDRFLAESFAARAFPPFSQAVADASQEKGIAFGDIGPVELKGVSGTVHLLRAHLA